MPRLRCASLRGDVRLKHVESPRYYLGVLRGPLRDLHLSVALSVAQYDQPDLESKGSTSKIHEPRNDLIARLHHSQWYYRIKLGRILE
jgi:hypothetical protein